MDRDALKERLILDEDLKLKPYRCPAGKLTIGIGRNIKDVGISRAEALMLCDNDIDRVEAELDRHVPWWRDLSERRQQALANMCFNMGWPRLAKFKNMLAALQAGDFDRAAAEAENSLWFKQVGARGMRIAAMIKEG
jgi:lysozyme